MKLEVERKTGSVSITAFKSNAYGDDAPLKEHGYSYVSITMTLEAAQKLRDDLTAQNLGPEKDAAPLGFKLTGPVSLLSDDALADHAPTGLHDPFNPAAPQPVELSEDSQAGGFAEEAQAPLV
jgi:hypothetical protein